MTTRGGTSQACAACKYQRRRCTPQCLFRPFFPSEEPKIFQNAHRLFGVSNIMKIIKNLNPQQREDAMESIIYESSIRARFPVTGCTGIIQQLHCEYQQGMKQLQHLNALIMHANDTMPFFPVSAGFGEDLDPGLPQFMNDLGKGSDGFDQNIDDNMNAMLVAQNPNIYVGNSQWAFPKVFSTQHEVGQHSGEVSLENLQIVGSMEACAQDLDATRQSQEHPSRLEIQN